MASETSKSEFHKDDSVAWSGVGNVIRSNKNTLRVVDRDTGVEVTVPKGIVGRVPANATDAFSVGDRIKIRGTPLTGCVVKVLSKRLRVDLDGSTATLNIEKSSAIKKGKC